MSCLRLLLLSICLLFANRYVQAQALQEQNAGDKTFFNNFLIREGLLKNNKIAIIACDSTEHPLEQVNGTFSFGVNGLVQSLVLKDGVAMLPQVIEHSTFIYLRHKNTQVSVGKLYYLLKTDGNIRPIQINGWIVLLIPALFLAIGTIFRRVLIFAITAAALLLLFNYSKGLSLNLLLQSLFDGLQNFS